MMRMRFGMKLSVLAVSALIVGAGAVSADTLRQALTKAYNNSGLLEQNRAVLRAADEDVAQAVSKLRPVFEWSTRVTQGLGDALNKSGNIYYDDRTAASIEISALATLFDGGTRGYSKAASKELVLATRQSLISVEQQVLLSAIEAYMDVHREAETVDLRESNFHLIQEELRAAKDRYEVGEVTKTDVALAEARLAESKSELQLAIGAYRQAKAMYVQVIGDSITQYTKLPKLPKLPDSLEAVQNIAFREHPELRKLQHSIKAHDFRISETKSSLGPKVTISGSYGLKTGEGFKTYNPSEMSINIGGSLYDGGNSPSLIRQAKARRDQEFIKLQILKREIQQTTVTTFFDFSMARSRREATEEQIRAAQVAFDGTKEEAKLGARTTLDVLNAEQDLLNAKANLISATIEEQIVAYRLLLQMGQLTVDHLNLPVQKYDPDAYYNHVKNAPAASDQGKALDRVLKALGQE